MQGKKYKEKELTSVFFLQWHLLEHAIDSILEAGEVPHT